jgi:Domain of unknown function (DUF1707)
MSTDKAIRASDADRERTVGILRDGYACGRLTLAEFDERTTAAFASRTWGDLLALTADLPPVRTGAQPPAGPAVAPRERRLASARAVEGARILPMALIAVFWLALILSVHGRGALIPIVFLVLMAVRWAGAARCGPGSSHQRRPWRDPPQRPGGQS